MLTLWKRGLSMTENFLIALAEYLAINVCETMEKFVSGHTDAEKIISLIGLLSPISAESGCHTSVNIH